MNLLNRYLIEVNSFQVFKKRRMKIFDRALIKFAAVSFLLLCTKFLAEFFVEKFIK